MAKIRWLVFALLLVVTTHASAAEWWLTPNGSEGMDTWFASWGSQASGMPNSSLIQIGGNGDTIRGEIRFNLSGFPRVATKASIWLYSIASNGAPTSIDWSLNLETWQEQTVTWNTEPWWVLGWSRTPPPTPPGWYEVDITNAYNLWRLGSEPFLNFGLRINPVSRNNQYNFFYSSDFVGNAGLRPTLYVRTSEVDNSKIVLKWPLPSSQPATPLFPFGADWGPGITACVGKPMLHAGVDITQNVGTVVTAMEDGIAKYITNNVSVGFQYALTMEHNHAWWGLYTTVLWHIIVDQWIADELNAGRKPFIPKGMRIGVTAAIDGTDHLHIGVRWGAYDQNLSSRGALPKNNDCAELPKWEEHFLNPLDTSKILFHY